MDCQLSSLCYCLFFTLGCEYGSGAAIGSADLTITCWYGARLCFHHSGDKQNEQNVSRSRRKSRSPVTNLVVHATATSGPCSVQGWCASVFPDVSTTEFIAAEGTTTTATDYSPLAKILHSCVRNKARAEFTTATRAISGRMSGVITP